MHRFKSKHVPALDGLRGLAILLVIAHHQLIPFSVKGGFLGVDLFFVLSGFLITTLLVTEFETTKTISFRNFYARRALRLGPALLVYLVVCLVVTYHSHLMELTRELKLIGIALAYSTNWRMAFSWDTSLDPTAIIWSLSIEEQFYLLWPVLFLACLLVKFKRLHIVAVLSLAILSIFFHRYLLWRSGVELNRLYYGTDTRADAPLVGCLIALIPAWRLSVSARKCLRMAGVLSALGLAYLVATVHFTDKVLYCGGYTGVAVMAGLLTWSAANAPARMLAACLESYPLRWLGKISYGLYLWHWLLLKTTTFYYLAGKGDPWVRFVVAIAVSALSFYLIERPFTKLKTRFAHSTGLADRSRIASRSRVDMNESVNHPLPTAAVIQSVGIKN